MPVSYISKCDLDKNPCVPDGPPTYIAFVLTPSVCNISFFVVGSHTGRLASVGAAPVTINQINNLK